VSHPAGGGGAVRAVVLIPAGGAGARLGGVAKPFLPLAGEPVLLHALRPFLACAEVVRVVVALPAALAASPPEWLAALDPRIVIVEGGAERGDSVRRALAAAGPSADIVLVHDAARPLLTVALVRRAIDAAAAGASVIAAVPVVDTIQEMDDAGTIVATPERSRLRQAQTPQAFPRTVLEAAHRRAAAEGVHATDDAALVARYGGVVRTIEGEPENLKITWPSDLVVAEALLGARARDGSNMLERGNA
jgi:2-C-methyl-D-erythritol 4-phosphate cytidylyltransferase